MTLANIFGFPTPGTIEGALPDVFPLTISKASFIDTDMLNLFTKILTDVVERTSGLPDDQAALLWDNCVRSDASEGLITMLAKAMINRGELFLVYEKSPVNVLRLAVGEEIRQIKEDYKTKATSEVGTYVSFKNYVRSDMLKLFSALEFATIGALNKSINVSAALQFKMKDLRGSVSAMNSADPTAQAKLIVQGLAEGKSVLMDGEDSIFSASPDLTPIESSISFLNQKRSFYLGLPESYISGEQTGGIGASGENDTKAVERGLKNYYYSIVKPILLSIFGVKTSYKSQDFRQVAQACEAIKTFTFMEDDSLLSKADQKKVINQLLDFDTESGSDA